MRGAQRPCGDRDTLTGIIPADAGSTQPLAESRKMSQDHPRGCGEHQALIDDPDAPVGSSPRMRGVHTLTQTNNLREQDHPRGCGEHTAHRRLKNSSRGSSPRMRGARMIADGHQHHRRIIPADAGSTGLRIYDLTASTDHPRGCGEHLKTYSMIIRWWGSSPRMRGAHWTPPCGPCSCRIIPADAGSTREPTQRGNRNPDHPRGCGEHSRRHANC